MASLQIYLIGFALSLISYCFYRSFRHSPLHNVPSPPQGPLWKRFFNEPGREDLQRWTEGLQHNGLIRYYGPFGAERLYVASPEGMETLLTTRCYDFQKPERQRDLVGYTAGPGLFLEEFDVHRGNRRILQTAFSPLVVRKKTAAIWRIAETLAEVLKQETTSGADSSDSLDYESPVRIQQLITNAAAECLKLAFSLSSLQEKSKEIWKVAGDLSDAIRFETSSTLGGGFKKYIHGPVRVQKLFSATAVDAVGVFLFDTDFKSLTKESDFNQKYQKMFKNTEYSRKVLPWASLFVKTFMNLPFRGSKAMRAAMQLARREAAKLVIDHVNKKDNSVGDGNLISTALASGKFTFDETVEQVVHFLGAGAEPVSASLSWMLHLLAFHPDAQQKLRDELTQHGLPLSSIKEDKIDQILALPYMNAVIEECLRYHNVNTVLWRESAVETVLCDVLIPKGVTITFSPHCMNRNKNYWGADVEAFKPERWLEGNTFGGAKGPYAHMSFSRGPRACIGQPLARLQMRCVLANLISRFAFSPVEGAEMSNLGKSAPVTFFKVFDHSTINVRVLG